MPEPEHVIATYDHSEFPTSAVLKAKGQTTVSIVIPARNEERTVGSVVSVVKEALMERFSIVDELVVIDDRSTDGTAAIARRAGATVVSIETPDVDEATSEFPQLLGKGGAMRRGLEATTGDIVVFLDGDVTNFRPHFVTGLLGPLLCLSDIDFVKGFYDRPFHGSATGGGRVTELTARPVISLCFPELAGVLQPLAGETAARRHVLEALAFESGYGVEMGLLLDVATKSGTNVIAQVDLGVRAHRNRSLADLALQAREVLAVALNRARAISR